MSDTELLKATDEAYNMIFKSTVDFFSVKAAFDLGLFNALADGPLTVEELAAKTESVPMRLQKFLIGLKQIGLVNQQGSQWELTPFTTQFYVKPDENRNLTMVPFVEYIGSAIESFYMHLADVVRGKLNFTSVIPYPPRTREDNMWYETMHRSNIYFPIKLLLDNGKFDNVRNLVDVGGGIGDVASAICGKYPDLKITLVNLPIALDSVRENVTAKGFGDRIDPVSVDMYRAPYPTGDGILFCRILYSMDAASSKMMIQKAFDALEPGGRVYVLDMIVADIERPNYDYLTHYLSSVGTDFVQFAFKPYEAYQDILESIGFKEIEHAVAYDYVLYQGVKPL